MTSSSDSEDEFKAAFKEKHGLNTKITAEQVWQLLRERRKSAPLPSADANTLTFRQFTSLRRYKRELANVKFWWPAIDRICKLHQLVSSLREDEVRPGSQPSTHPVFLIGDRLVIKFYASRLYSSSKRNFRVERDLYSWLRLPNLSTPQLLASGTLDEWPYIVTTAVPGHSFAEVQLTVSPSDRHQLAVWLGQTLRYLHQIPLEEHPDLLQMRAEFTEFIHKQERKCVERHRRWHTLPEHLLAQIPSYLQAHGCPKPSCLIHGDLSCNHVFGDAHSSDVQWRATGLIDFGDARVGDPIYELVVLHCGLFELNTSLLRAFLQAYQSVNDHIASRAMTSMLLFEFNIFQTVLEHRPDAFSSVQTLDELAESIWGIKATFV